MGGRCFNLSGAAAAHTPELALGPVNARSADARGEGGIVGDQQDQSTLATGAREGLTGGDAAGRAVVAPDDAKAARQAFHDRQRIRCADGVGDEDGAWQRLAIASARGFCETGRRQELAADRGLG